MLILNPGLLDSMDDGHLLASLDCEPEILRTAVERELIARCERLADELAEYESQLEQSEFRAQLIQKIIVLCDKPGSKKDLVVAIKMALKNSYVEL